MENKEKKMAAALAAVAAYMQREEESLYKQLAAMAPKSQAPMPPQNVWGLSGRQSMMQMRNLMQLKGLHRLG